MRTLMRLARSARDRGRDACRALVLAIVTLAVTMASASPLPTTAPSALASAPDDPDHQLDQVQAALARLQAQAEAGSTAPLLEEQRNLNARLAVLLTAERRRRMAAGDAAGPHAAQDAEVVADPVASLGPPPHAVAALDNLRDEQDALQAQQRSLEVTARALDHQVTALLAARRKAEETVRLRQELAARARDPAAQERLTAEAEVARLEARIAGLELARADAERAELRARVERLRVRSGLLQREIERARPHQTIDDDAVEQVLAAARGARQALTGQRRQLEARLAARERQLATGPGTPGAAARELTALRERLALLAELDQIEAGREEVWRLRRLALASGGDPAARAEATTVIRRSIDQLALRAQGAAEQLDLGRAALRAQRLRVQGLADGTEASAERQALDALQQEVDTRELVLERLQHLQRQLQRSFEDLDGPALATPLGDRAWAAVRAAVKAVWQYELFSASDVQQVDGRSVTVDYGVTVGKSIGVVGLFALGWLVASRISRAAIGLLVRRLQLSPQLGRVLNRWFMSLLLLGVLIVVLKLARIPLTAFAFLGGALAIGVGFGTQNIIKNLISGVIILFERKVRVGDIVTIDGVSGTVTSVDLRATTVRGFDGIEAIVPNSSLLENRVSNWSYGSATVRRAIAVGLRHGSDMRAASALVQACARAHPAVLDSPAPEVLFDDFGPDAQVLRLQYWVQLGGAQAGPAVDSDLRHAIAEALAGAGLVIAHPQRDVHLGLTGPIDVHLKATP